jgi:hypothetical protein
MLFSFYRPVFLVGFGIGNRSQAETKEVRFYNTTARSDDVINIGFYQSQRSIVPRGMREYAHGGRNGGPAGRGNHRLLVK